MCWYWFLDGATTGAPGSGQGVWSSVLGSESEATFRPPDPEDEEEGCSVDGGDKIYKSVVGLKNQSGGLAWGREWE